MKILELNTNKPVNYAFYDPISNLHLTLTKRKGRVNKLNKNIKKAIKDNTLILRENKKTKNSKADKTLEKSNKEKKKKNNNEKDDNEKDDNEKDDGKVACQYCGKKYSKNGVKRHESTCDANPENK